MRSVSAALALCAAFSACAPRQAPGIATGVQQSGSSATQAATSTGGGAHWIRDPSGAHVEPFAVLPDGTRLFSLDGLRIEQRPDGALRQASELLPTPVETVELPDWLGGGYVFVAELDRSTSLWRAATWTAPLKPLTRVRSAIEQVVPGFDRLYLRGAQGRALHAIDAISGEALDLGSLPPSSSYGSLAFATPWLGAVNSDVRGALVTFDAGLSWHPLAREAGDIRLSVEQRRLEVRSSHELSLVDESGAIVAPPHDEEVELDGVTPASRVMPPLGGSALRLALLQGFELDSHSAAVVSRGILARVRLSDGAIVRRHVLRDAQATQCQGYRLGRGHGFVCGTDSGPTIVYRYEEHFALTRVLEFTHPRNVAATGTGGLVFDGPCERAASGAALAATHCLYDGERQREIRAPGDGHRLALLANGAVAIVKPPRERAPGTLTLVGANQSDQHDIELSALSQAQRSLLSTAFWLNPLRQLPSGELAAWVMGDRHLMGVRITLSGKLEAGPIRSELPHALLGGTVGVVLSAGGVGYETRDHGFEWRRFRLPEALGALDPYAINPRAVRAGEPRGCSAMGCVLGAWLRVGFGSEQTGFEEASEPPELKSLSQGMPHWSLDCAATGVTRGGRAELAAMPTQTRFTERIQAPAGSSPFEQVESSSWRRFLGALPPVRSPSDLGLDFGHDDTRVQFHGYAWGPRSNAWRRSAQWLVRVANRFETDALWSTQPTRAPWVDPMRAAASFSADRAATPSDWALMLDAGGEAGVLRIRAGSDTEVYLLERDRPIVPVMGGFSGDWRRPLSAVRVAGRVYVGSQSEGMLSVHRVEGGRPTLLGRYPQLATDSVRIELVTTRNSDALALWVRTADNGWFFFPIDTDTGAPAPPTHIPLARLGAVPPSCDDDAEGWHVISEVPLATLGGSAANVWLAFSGELSDLRARQLEARVIASAHGLCLNAVAGQLDDSSVVPASVRAQVEAETKPVALTLTDRTTERRFGFRCSR